MQVFMRQLLTLATSLVLALPPGACGLFPLHAGTEARRVTASCCQHLTPPHQGQGSHQEKLPAMPVAQCCCARDATLPEKSVPPADVPLAALFTIPAEFVPDFSGWSVGEVPRSYGLFGARLHVLQCVWLC